MPGHPPDEPAPFGPSPFGQGPVARAQAELEARFGRKPKKKPRKGKRPKDV